MKLFRTPLLAKYKNILLLLLRLVVAFIFLWHGLPKAIDPAMASEKFIGMGFPGFLGTVVGWAEVIASIMIIFGWFHSLGNMILGVIIFVALVEVQLAQGIVAGFERDLLILVALLMLLVFGPGKYALDKE